MYSASDRLETGNFIFFSSTSNCGKAADITCAFLYPDKEELQLSHWENETLKKKWRHEFKWRQVWGGVFLSREF